MTSNIIPFKGSKPKNTKRSFDSFSDVKDFLLSSTEDGMVDLGDEQVDKFNRLVETAPDDEMDSFLLAISKKISAIDWINRADSPLKVAKKDGDEHVSFLRDQFSYFENVEKCKREIIQDCYSLEDLKKGEPDYFISSVKTSEEKNLKKRNFIIDLFKKLIETRGVTDGLAIAYTDILKYWDAQSFELLGDNNFKKITKEDLLLVLQKRQRDVWEKEADKKNPEHIIWLFQLLEVKYDEGKNLDGVCNAIIRAVKSATIEDIENAMYNTDLWGELETADINVVYIDKDSAEKKNLMVTLSEEVYRERKYNHKVAFNFGIFYTYFYESDEWIEHCHPEFLFPACGGTNIGLSFPDWMFKTGKTFLTRNKANEALHCFKRSFMDNIFDHQLSLSKEDIDAIIRATRLTGEYQDIIRFLSIFPGLLERGVLPDLRFWGTLEEIRVKLEIEHRTLGTRKIDDFYEIVAREDYPSLLKHLDAPEKKSNDIILTKDQLKCLIEKINEKTTILSSLQDMNAKTDTILQEQKRLYEKKEHFFDALKENGQELLAAINQKAETIIDSLPEVSEKNLKGKDLSSYEKYYQNYFTEELWSRLEPETQQYFLHARSLYDSHKWSTIGDFDFVALKYAKAIENEFIEKIIKKFISLNEKIVLGECNKPFVIDSDSYLTFGSICTILNLSKKDPTNDFVKFLKSKTTGGEGILKFKNTLFNIKDNFRNPAAHPYSYNRTKVDEFEKLLFVDQFLRDFMEQIQPVLGEKK